MNKVYIAIEENYNILANEVGACSILGVYTDIENAVKKITDEINVNINECDYVLDDQDDIDKFKKEKQGYLTMFYKYQENWDYYSEYSIIEKEV